MSQDEARESKLTASDKKFVKKAYKGGMEEVANGKWQRRKPRTTPPRNVAERMITDHSKVNEKLIKSRRKKISTSRRSGQDGNMSGDNFDKEYLTMLKADHEKDIAEFEKEANDTKPGEDRDVPAFAKENTPDPERAPPDGRRCPRQGEVNTD